MRVIGFDIGGSTLRAGLISVDDHATSIDVRRHLRLRDEDKAPAVLLEKVVELVVELSGADSPESVEEPVGIGFPGQLTPDGQHVVVAPNLGWREVPFGAMLAERLPRTRARVDNDLNVILLGETRFGVAKGRRHVVALYPGTGIGGAVMVNGRIVRGLGGFAGEVGHVDMGSGIVCGCGQVGCAETIAGGRYLNARLAEARAAGELDGPAWAEFAEIGVAEADAAFAAGDPFAQTLWAEVLDVLSGIAATACALLNPEVVVLGGGVVTHAPHLRAALREAIVQRSPEVCRRGLRVEEGTLGDDAGLLGAAALALESD